MQSSLNIQCSVLYSLLSWFSHNCSIDRTVTNCLVNLPNAGYIIFFNHFQIDLVKQVYEVPDLQRETLNTSNSPGILMFESLPTHALHVCSFFFFFSTMLSHFKLQRNTSHSVVSSSSVCGWIDFSLYQQNKWPSLASQNISRVENAHLSQTPHYSKCTSLCLRDLQALWFCSASSRRL